MSVEVDAPGATVDGKTISEWSKDWWKWIVNGPKDPYNQSDDKTGALSWLNNGRPVFFLAGNNPFTSAGNNSTRYIVVPHDKPILVPVLNFIDIEGPGITPAESGTNYKALVKQTLKSLLATVDTSSLHVTIDGHPVNDLRCHLETTDFFSMGVVKPGTLLTSSNIGVAPGAVMAVDKAAGYWVMLEGLSRGVHTVSFGGSTFNPMTPATQTTDHLIVV